jgi:hypothetical protein
MAGGLSDAAEDRLLTEGQDCLLANGSVQQAADPGPVARSMLDVPLVLERQHPAVRRGQAQHAIDDRPQGMRLAHVGLVPAIGALLPDNRLLGIVDEVAAIGQRCKGGQLDQRSPSGSRPAPPAR